MVVHSHVLEHFYDPNPLLQHIAKFLKKGDKQVFSIPNLYLSLKNKFTNTLNFEHTYLLTEYFTDYLLEKHGFKVLGKKYFGEHSIFYATEKGERENRPVLSNHYNHHKQLFLDFVHYYLDEVKRLNALIDSFDGEVYLFGAHIFSQFLVHQGLRARRIVDILDNSSTKTGKRLYGTSLRVDLPQAIAEKQPVAVIVKAGGYQREVTAQLMNINANVVVWE